LLSFLNFDFFKYPVVYRCPPMPAPRLGLLEQKRELPPTATKVPEAPPPFFFVLLINTKRKCRVSEQKVHVLRGDLSQQ
jgi:hypothetical protein